MLTCRGLLSASLSGSDPVWTFSSLHLSLFISAHVSEFMFPLLLFPPVLFLLSHFFLCVLHRDIPLFPLPHLLLHLSLFCLSSPLLCVFIFLFLVYPLISKLKIESDTSLSVPLLRLSFLRLYTLSTSIFFLSFNLLYYWKTHLLVSLAGHCVRSLFLFLSCTTGTEVITTCIGAMHQESMRVRVRTIRSGSDRDGLREKDKGQVFNLQQHV